MHCKTTAHNLYDDFIWAIPKAFKEALRRCRFEEGDVIYDTPLAYEGNWAEALNHIKYRIEIHYPPTGNTTKQNKESDSMFLDNWIQPVEFTIRNYSTGENLRFTTTQGALYCHLWKCDNKLAVSSPGFSPKRYPDVILDWKKDSSNTRSLFNYTPNTYFFLMPYDETEDFPCSKVDKLRETLSSNIKYDMEFRSPEFCVLPEFDKYLPTVQIACFTMHCCDKSIAMQQIELALKTKESIVLSSHGLFFS